MVTRSIPKRTRFFFAVEGESEQSFIKWLQGLTDQQGLSVHLHCQSLGGGGYSSMLKQAHVYRERGLSNGKYKGSFLLVDEDRATSGDDWSIEQLKQEASCHNISLCCQRPNFEALLLRMMPGKERSSRDASAVASQLAAAWPTYRKPVNARDLGGKYTLDDLTRIASLEPDLQGMLKSIGLIQ